LLPSRSKPPSFCVVPSSTDEYIMDLTKIDDSFSLEGVALSPMVTTICDQLMFDWENSKIKRMLLCTTTHSYETTKKPHIPG